MQKKYLGLIFGLGMIHAVTGMATELGKEVYERACAACHAPEMAKQYKQATLGSLPLAAFDVRHWQAEFHEELEELVEEGIIKEKNLTLAADPKQWPNEYYKLVMQRLIATVRKGKGLMPKGGQCYNTTTADGFCLDEEYRASIEYMMTTQPLSSEPKESVFLTKEG